MRVSRASASARTPRSTSSSPHSRVRIREPSAHCTIACSAGSSRPGTRGTTFGGIGSFDMALWDLKAKIAGEPLWRLLGGRDRHVPGYASGFDIALDDETLFGFYRGMADHGFTSGKLKGGRRRGDGHPAARRDRRCAFTGNRRTEPDARCERVVEPQAGSPLRACPRGGPRPHVDRGAASAVGCRGTRSTEPRGAGRRRDRREPDGPRAVPGALRRTEPSTSSRPARTGA